jgi:hypothetical protein
MYLHGNFPTTFQLHSYRYVLEDNLEDIGRHALNSKVVIRFPTEVEIHAQRWPDSIGAQAIPE